MREEIWQKRRNAKEAKRMFDEAKRVLSGEYAEDEFEETYEEFLQSVDFDKLATDDETFDKLKYKSFKPQGETHNEYCLRIHIERREAVLNANVKDRCCPLCKKLRPKLKQWVVLEEYWKQSCPPRVEKRWKAKMEVKKKIGHKCICKSCWIALTKEKKLTRKQILDKRVSDRRCPKCKRIKLRSRQWIIYETPDGIKVPICKSCWMKGKKDV